MAKRGRPSLPYPRHHGVYVRFSDTEWGALVRTLAAEYPVAARRPTVPEAIRDLVVAHASAVLGVEVTRAALRHAQGGVPDWKRWRLARAVRAAAPRRRQRRK
jgi:MoxR-like ATPase